jgi:hypothetical protein
MSFHRLCLAAVLGSLTVSCASVDATDEAPAEETPRGVSNLRAAFVTAVQSNAGEHFATRVDGESILAATAFDAVGASFREEGVSLVRSGDSVPALTLRTKSFGCEGAREAVDAATPQSEGNRVTYSRGPVVEWWLNGPLGLEQGFDIAEQPACALAGDALAVDVELGGANEAHLDASGREVHMTGPDGLRLQMTDVFAFDANGQELPVRLELDNGTLSLLVDAQDAAYPVTIDPVVKLADQVVQASNYPSGAYFGSSVAMKGDRAVIAADDYAYVFDYVGGLWSQSALLATPGFGASVAMDGNTIAVSGSTQVMVFTESAGVWSLQQTVTGGGHGGYPHNFPDVLAISGDTIVVAARQSNFVDILVRSGSTWTKQQTLSVNMYGYPPSFGTSLSVAGNTLVVGSPYEVSGEGRTYVYSRSGTVWTQNQVIAPSPGYALFGNSVALSGGTILVGAPQVLPAGAAFVYTLNGSTYTYQQTLTSPLAWASSRLGVSVALDGDTAVTTTDYSYGSASPSFLFYRSGGVWYESIKLLPVTSGSLGYFGHDVTVAGNHVLISEPGASKAHFFEIDPSQYLGCLGAADGTACDDGDACTTSDVCQSGACVGVTLDNDADGVPNCGDNCVNDYNPSQLDLNADFKGDACATACVDVKRGGTLGAVYDTFISQAAPNVANGSNIALRTGANNGLPVRSLVRFDLSFLPNTTILQSATLGLGVKSTVAGSPSVTLHNITSPWVEATTTWSSFANAFNAATLTSFAPTLGKKSLDVTSTAATWIGAGAVNHGLLLQQATGNTSLASAEGTPVDARPFLKVCYTAPGY